MIRPVRAILLVLLAAALASCASTSKRRKVDENTGPPPSEWNIGRIAVMPPECWTEDFDLEYVAWYRALINEFVRARGWATVPVTEVNRQLNQLRFGAAGEIAQLSPAQAAERFGADALLYWCIPETKGDVRLAFELVRKDGTSLWTRPEARANFPFVAHPTGSADGMSTDMSMTIAEFLKDFPARP